MLILKTNQDLPISVRNVGHSIGDALSRLEMTFSTELHLNEEATSKVEDHLYRMFSIGSNVKRLGEPETFDVTKLYTQLNYYQNSYSTHATGILTDLSKTGADLEPIAAMLINEINRTFVDEIQMSSVNRLEELQNLLETTAISTIAGLLRLDWSAVSFIKMFEDLYDRKNADITTAIRDSVVERLQSGEEFDYEKELSTLSKHSEEQISEFTKTEISERCSEMMKEKYDEMFIINEDLSILKSKAIDVASNCLLRGSAKKMILSNLSKQIDLLNENLKPIVDSFKVKKVKVEDVEKILETFREDVTNKSFEAAQEDDETILAAIETRSLETNEFVITYEDAFVEYMLDLKEKKVKVSKESFLIAEILDPETQLPIMDEKFVEIATADETIFTMEKLRISDDLERLLNNER